MKWRVFVDQASFTVKGMSLKELSKELRDTVKEFTIVPRNRLAREEYV